jgi:nitrogen-specific signal transduction histidine kinase/ActR/RegA family two-component response regulator
MAIKLDVTREMALESQYRQSQKLEGIGQLAGGVAHDFNNILTSILMQVELANLETGLPKEVLDGLEQIRRDADRAASLTRQLLLFSRRQVMQSRDLDLNEIVTNLAKMLQRIIGEDVRLQLELDPGPLPTRADAGMLDQVAMNLAVNARDAMPEGGTLRISTSEKVVDEAGKVEHPDAIPGRYVCLSVSDTGCGIAPEVLPRIFEPFFTTKDAGKGTGLGLATVFGIVKQHHGWLTVDTELRKGSTFKIYLPAVAAAAATPASAAAAPKPCGGTETILLAEDDHSVRRATASLLRQQGYQVLEAANGVEALQSWIEHRSGIALLFTDLVMPEGLSGRQLAEKLQAEKPDLKVIFASGHSADIAGKEIQLRAGENFMPKPIRPDELLKIIRSCLDSASGTSGK